MFVTLLLIILKEIFILVKDRENRSGVSVCPSMHPLQYHRGDHVYLVAGNLFSDIQQMTLFVIREEISQSCWERTEIQFQHVKGS